MSAARVWLAAAALTACLPLGQGGGDSYGLDYLGLQLTVHLDTTFSADALARDFCVRHSLNETHVRSVRELIENRAVAHLGEGRLNEYWHGSEGPEADAHAHAVVTGICRDFPRLHRMPYDSFERRELPVRVIDAFTFFNELDILDIRLRELEGVVDKFVLVESAHSHTGLAKNLTFEQHSDQFERFLDDHIVHVVLDQLPDAPDHWVRERSQREGIHRGLEHAAAAPGDLILVSDVDEIPRASTVRALSWCQGYRTPLQLRSAFFYYSFRHRWTVPAEGGGREPHQWNQPRAIFVEQMAPPRLTVNHVRYDTGEAMEAAFDASWHLSFWGGEERIKAKLKNYAHQENNVPEFTNGEAIQKAMNEGHDLFQRGSPHGELTPNDEPYDLPAPVLSDVVEGLRDKWGGYLPEGFDAEVYVKRGGDGTKQEL